MKLTWNKYTSFGAFFIAHIVFVLLMWFHLMPWPIQTITAFIYLLILPGLYIERIIHLPFSHPFKTWIVRISLSVTYIMLIGLMINYLLPFLGINTPLTFIPLIIGLFSCHTILLIICAIRTDMSLLFTIPHLNRLNISIVMLTFLLPILTVFGAISLNNGGSNIFILIFLGCAGLSIAYIALTYHKLTTGVLAWYIFMLGAATLLMFSLRSSYISGFDISREFFLFQLTKLIAHWDMSNFRDAYNACLSITIFPTILSHFMALRDENIYKFLYPLLFALVPVNIFFIAKKFTNEIVGLLASVFFISHPWFIDPMVTLTRQEIGFIFFSLLILTIFSEELPFLKRTILYSLVAISIILSHYSTTYITIILLIGALIGSSIIRGILFILEKTPLLSLMHRFRIDTIRKEQSFINGWYVLILIVFSYIWLSLITGASNNMSDFITKTVNNLHSSSLAQSRSGIVNQVLSGSQEITMDTYTSFYKSKLDQYKHRTDIYRYPQTTYSDFRISPKNPKNLSIKSPTIYSIANSVYKTLIVTIQLFFVSGVLLSLVLLRERFRLDYFILVFSCIVILAAITFFPYISQEYNFDRLYLQTMVVMSLFAVIGAMSTLHFTSRIVNIPYYIIPVVMVILMYWYSFGFIWQFVGGKTVVWLNNFGFYYDISYTHKGEVLAGYWLGNRYKKKLVYANATGRNILSAYTNIFTFNTDVFPPAIDQNSYVFLTRTSVIDKISYFYVRGLNLGYNFPYSFLENNKNKIYSSGVSEIYK